VAYYDALDDACLTGDHGLIPAWWLMQCCGHWITTTAC
jgi:hypothetical protein